MEDLEAVRLRISSYWGWNTPNLLVLSHSNNTLFSRDNQPCKAWDAPQPRCWDTFLPVSSLCAWTYQRFGQGEGEKEKEERTVCASRAFFPGWDLPALWAQRWPWNSKQPRLFRYCWTTRPAPPCAPRESFHPIKPSGRYSSDAWQCTAVTFSWQEQPVGGGIPSGDSYEAVRHLWHKLG